MQDERVGPASAASTEATLRELASRAEAAADRRERLRLLLDAVLQTASDLTPAGVLERILTVARALTGATYAAIGEVDDGGGIRLRALHHQGLEPELADKIGDLPTGRGVLGLTAAAAGPVRLADLRAHPAALGFPDDHPPMTGFLGVPIRVRGRVHGHLYLTDKAGGAPFDADDEELVVALAAAAGVAIGNARLHQAAVRRNAWLEAAAEVQARLLDPAADDGDVLELVAERARQVAGADVAWVATGSGPDDLAIRVVSGIEVEPDVAGRVPLRHSLSSLVLATGEPVAVADLAADPRAADPSGLPDWPRLGPAVVVPMGSGEEVEGTLTLAWLHSRAAAATGVDPRLPATFADQAALARRVARARSSSERRAVLEDRQRIAADLHDLVVQRLFAVGLTVEGVTQRVADPEVAARLDRVVADLDAVIRELRHSIFALGTAGDGADLAADAARIGRRAAAAFGLDVSVTVAPHAGTWLPRRLAPDVLAVLTEALAGAGGRCATSAVGVTVRAEDRADGRRVVLEVRDDGADDGACEGARDADVESALASMRARARRHGGWLESRCDPVAGTTLTWTVPARGDQGP